MNVPLKFISRNIWVHPLRFMRSQPSDFDHTQSQLSKSMGYGKHDISKSINIEDSIFCIE